MIVAFERTVADLPFAILVTDQSMSTSLSSPDPPTRLERWVNQIIKAAFNTTGRFCQ
ncbi:hypothetical protein ACNKHV_06975 [Shigella flexneri]